MAASVIEVEFLEGIDLDNTPPCNIAIHRDGPMCGQPSVVRIKVSCCNYTITRFLCQGHYDELLNRSGRQLMCSYCHKPVKTWSQS